MERKTDEKTKTKAPCCGSISDPSRDHKMSLINYGRGFLSKGSGEMKVKELKEKVEEARAVHDMGHKDQAYIMLLNIFDMVVADANCVEEAKGAER